MEQKLTEILTIVLLVGNLIVSLGIRNQLASKDIETVSLPVQDVAVDAQIPLLVLSRNGSVLQGTTPNLMAGSPNVERRVEVRITEATSFENGGIDDIKKGALLSVTVDAGSVAGDKLVAKNIILSGSAVTTIPPSVE